MGRDGLGARSGYRKSGRLSNDAPQQRELHDALALGAQWASRHAQRPQAWRRLDAPPSQGRDDAQRGCWISAWVF